MFSWCERSNPKPFNVQLGPYKSKRLATVVRDVAVIMYNEKNKTKKAKRTFYYFKIYQGVIEWMKQYSVEISDLEDMTRPFLAVHHASSPFRWTGFHEIVALQFLFAMDESFETAARARDTSLLNHLTPAAGESHMKAWGAVNVKVHEEFKAVDGAGPKDRIRFQNVEKIRPDCMFILKNIYIVLELDDPSHNHSWGNQDRAKSCAVHDALAEFGGHGKRLVIYVRHAHKKARDEKFLNSLPLMGYVMAALKGADEAHTLEEYFDAEACVTQPCEPREGQQYTIQGNRRILEVSIGKERKKEEKGVVPFSVKKEEDVGELLRLLYPSAPPEDRSDVLEVALKAAKSNTAAAAAKEAAAAEVAKAKAKAKAKAEAKAGAKARDDEVDNKLEPLEKAHQAFVAMPFWQAAVAVAAAEAEAEAEAEVAKAEAEQAAKNEALPDATNKVLKQQRKPLETLNV